MADADFWGVMTIFGLVAYIAFQFILLSTRYKRCASDEIIVVFGRVEGGKTSKVIHGGAVMVWPLIQDYKKLSLVPMYIEIEETKIQTQDGSESDFPATFTIAISTDPDIMNNAAERLLHLGQNEIEGIASEILSSQLRITVESRTIEQIKQNRDNFLEALTSNVDSKLNQLGLYLINVNYRLNIRKSQVTFSQVIGDDINANGDE